MRIFAAALALIALAGIAIAQETGGRFDHNGSIVEVNWNGEHDFSINYIRPKPGIGVEYNTILVDGWIGVDDQINATARVFKSGCNPATYEVTGTFDNNYFELSGLAPARWNGCTPVGREWNEHSTLTFRRVRN